MIKGQFLFALDWKHFLSPYALNYCVLYTRVNGHGQLKHHHSRRIYLNIFLEKLQGIEENRKFEGLRGTGKCGFYLGANNTIFVPFPGSENIFISPSIFFMRSLRLFNPKQSDREWCISPE